MVGFAFALERSSPDELNIQTSLTASWFFSPSFLLTFVTLGFFFKKIIGLMQLKCLLTDELLKGTTDPAQQFIRLSL